VGLDYFSPRHEKKLHVELSSLNEPPFLPL
jgi:hypothetical protein